MSTPASSLPSEFQSQLYVDFLAQAGVVGGLDKVGLLTQAWINERNSPDMLAYRRSLVEPLIETLENQVRVKQRERKGQRLTYFIRQSVLQKIWKQAQKIHCS
jgi:hypothetical protein